MDDELYMRLAAAIERYLVILADHGLILDAECGAFINEPVYGAYEFLIRGMQVIDPFYPRVECLRSTLGPDETHDRLEHQLVEFAGVLEALCGHCETSNGIDPIQDVSDPVTSRIGLALLSVDIAAERLRAEGDAHGDSVTDRAREVLAQLRAEGDAEAIERHRLTRRTSRP